jgi:hydroxymethylpyrimidine/phosphomethylpyrimidine kinase
MSKNRPFVLSIAGFDPSGGQEFWLIKTFEQHEVYGLAIHGKHNPDRNNFYEIEWTS